MQVGTEELNTQNLDASVVFLRRTPLLERLLHAGGRRGAQKQLEPAAEPDDANESGPARLF